MSVTIYVDGWAEQPSFDVKNHEMVSWMEPEYAEALGYPKDEKGYYQMDKVYIDAYPDMNLSNANWGNLSRVLGLEFEGHIEAKDIPTVLRKCVEVINSKSKVKSATRQPETGSNFYSFGIDSDYVSGRISEFMDILRFAQEKGKDVYWC